MTKPIVWILSGEHPPMVDGGLGRHIETLIKGISKKFKVISSFVNSESYAEFPAISYGENGNLITYCNETNFTDILVDETKYNSEDTAYKDNIVSLNNRVTFFLKMVYYQYIHKEVLKGTPVFVHAHDMTGLMLYFILQVIVMLPSLSTIHILQAPLRLHTYLSKEDMVEFTNKYKTVSIKGKTKDDLKDIVNMKLITSEEYYLRKPNALIHVAETTKREVENLYGETNPESNFTIYNSYNSKMDTRLPHSYLRRKGRRKLGIKNSDFAICLSGRHGKQKGFKRVLEVLDRLPENVVVYIIGKVQEETKDITEIAKHTDRIRFVDFQKDIKDLKTIYNAFDLGLVPSVFEPFGIIALEYMLCKIPVVVNDVGGLHEIIEDGVNGFKMKTDNVFFNEPDHEELIKAITKVMDLPTFEKKALTKRAYKDVKKRFSEKAFIKNTIKAYEYTYLKDLRDNPEYKEAFELLTVLPYGLSTIREKFALYMLSKENNGNIVEIGGLYGASTCWISKGADASKKKYSITSIDPFNYPIGIYHEGLWPELNSKGHKDVFFDMIKKHNCKNIKHLAMDSKEAWRFFKDDSIDLLFIDGDHSYEGVKADFNLWLPKVKKGGVIAMHDTGKTAVSRKYGAGPQKVLEEFVRPFEGKKFTDLHRVDTLTYFTKSY